MCGFRSAKNKKIAMYGNRSTTKNRPCKAVDNHKKKMPRAAVDKQEKKEIAMYGCRSSNAASHVWIPGLS
jgi:hypothetical protein